MSDDQPETPIPAPNPSPPPHLAMAIGIVGAITGALALFWDKSNRIELAVPAIGLLALVTLLHLFSIDLVQNRDTLEVRSRAIKIENDYRNDPKPEKAWEIARLNLQDYFSHNKSQVRMMFWLVAIVMIIGLSLIFVGVVRAIMYPGSIELAVLSACSGIIVQIIAGTFLIVYRSTMAQAQTYVVVLERINAVAMAINVVDSIDGEDLKVRNDTRAEIARSLLLMYGIQKSSAPKRRTERGTDSPPKKRRSPQIEDSEA